MKRRAIIVFNFRDCIYLSMSQRRPASQLKLIRQILGRRLKATLPALHQHP